MEDNNSNPTDFSRRKVLQSTAIAGAAIGTGVASGNVSARQNKDATDLGDVIFAEVGLQFNSESLSPTGTVCQMSFYKIDKKNSRLHFTGVTSPEADEIRNNDAVYRNNRVSGLPTVVNKGTISNEIALNLNKKLKTSSTLQFDGKIKMPALRIQAEPNESITLSLGPKEVNVKSGDSGNLDLSVTSITPKGGNNEVTPTEVIPQFRLQNHGRLDVTADNIREVNQR